LTFFYVSLKTELATFLPIAAGQFLTGLGLLVDIKIVLLEMTITDVHLSGLSAHPHFSFIVGAAKYRMYIMYSS
jgi:hypothetical protein